MTTANLKSNLHRIIDEIENDQLLESLIDLLHSHQSNKTGNVWNSLSNKEKEEVMIAWHESESDENLLNREEFFERD